MDNRTRIQANKFETYINIFFIHFSLSSDFDLSTFFAEMEESVKMHEHPIVHSCMNYENVKKNIKVSSVYFPGGRNNIIINILSINTIL